MSSRPASASLGNVASARNQRAQIPVVQGNAFGMAYGAYGALFTLAATAPKNWKT